MKYHLFVRDRYGRYVPNPNDIATWALIYRVAGFSVVPAYEPGSIASSWQWQPFRRRFATGREIVERFGNDAIGLYVICGAISLFEILAFRSRRWLDAADSRVGDITHRLPIVRTDLGRYHAYYRAENATGSEVLARHPVTNRPTIRKYGEGSRVIAIPGSAAVRQTDLPDAQIRGPVLPDCPLLTSSERRHLLSVCRRLTGGPEE